jgi:hypothetical protein
MHAITPRIRRAVVAAIVAGLVAVGVLGAVDIAVAPAGAATPATSQQQSVIRLSHQMARLEKHFNCSNAVQRLTQVKRIEEKFARGEARVEKRVAMAQKSGHTKQAAYWEKVLAHKERFEKKLLNARFLSRAAKVSTAAEAKCHTTVPAVVPLPALTPRTKPARSSTTTTAPPTVGSSTTSTAPPTAGTSTTVPATTGTPTTVPPAGGTATTTTVPENSEVVPA